MGSSLFPESGNGDHGDDPTVQSFVDLQKRNKVNNAVDIGVAAWSEH